MGFPRVYTGGLVFWLVGCSSEYAVKEASDPPEAPFIEVSDTGEDTASADTGALDTGTPTADTGAEEGPDESVDTDDPMETDEPVDTGVPYEEESESVACAPGADGSPVGCTQDVGAGRLFVWGDEHVAFEEYRPASERFWETTLTWLSDAGRVTVDDRTGSAVVSDVAARLGLTMGGPSADIVIVDLWRGVTGADISIWLAEGRAVMVMAIGFGASECTYLSAVTSGLPLTYDCAAEPWGPVGAFAIHPIATGLAVTDAPFVNGRRVVADDPTAAAAVAFVP